MQGLYVHLGGRTMRPASKKVVKEAVAADPSSVSLEATSMFGREYNGPVSQMPEGVVAYAVGPDPYTNRKFYLNITRKGDKVIVK